MTASGCHVQLCVCGAARPEEHPLIAIRAWADHVLRDTSSEFDGVYARGVGWPNIGAN
jgi:hypothetical protein